MIVYCLGLQASGSTWLYNIVRSIFTANGLAHAALRIEEMQDLENPLLHHAKHAVMRAHNTNSHLLRFLEAAEARAILSFRDPRDCVTSSMQRFGRHPIPLCNDIARNLASLHSARASLRCLGFVYEENFTGTVETIWRCAAFLRLPVSAAQAEAIFETYRAEAVAARFAKSDAPEHCGGFINAVTMSQVDRETSFHRGHISDGRIGKWRDLLPPETQTELQTLFGGCLAPPDAPASPFAVPAAPAALTFESRLFRPVDNMLEFRRQLPVGELRSPLGVKVLSDIYLSRGVWRLTLSIADGEGVIELMACQNGAVIHRAAAAANRFEFVWMNALHDHPFDFHLAGPWTGGLAPESPPPECTLRADLLWSDAGLRPGITDTGVASPEPEEALFAPLFGAAARDGLERLSPGQRALRRIVLLHRALWRPGTFLDVGAYCGDVGLALAGYDRGNVVAVEPLPEAALELRRRVRRRPVRVIEAALGELDDAQAILNVPLLRGAPVWTWASNAKDFAPLARACPEITGTIPFRVPVRSVDGLGLTEVTAIHVNVQGAEAAVLRGARETLLRDRPVLTVELEERHAPGVTREVPSWLRELEYEAYFEVDGRVHPIDEFDAARMQVSGRSPADEAYSTPYVNCFYFLPREDAALHDRVEAQYGRSYISL